MPLTPTRTVKRVPDRDHKSQVNVRLTSYARNLLALLSRQWGISQADVLERVIREEAMRLGLITGKH